MHLFAHDENKQRIFALDAEKQRDYACIECGSLVRKRGGESVQDHFWHVHPRKNCSLSNKTAVHLHIQYHLLKMLPLNEALLECRFPSIQRIADVAWVTEKILFEVQYSPISRKEVLERIKDYNSVGWQVVWILHTKEFNKRKVTGAEMALEEHTHYFTDINEKGVGRIWDQLDIKERGLRLIGLEKRFPLLNMPKKSVGKRTFRPIWQVYFEGDLIDRPPVRLPKKPKRALFLLELYNRLLDRLLKWAS